MDMKQYNKPTTRRINVDLVKNAPATLRKAVIISDVEEITQTFTKDGKEETVTKPIVNVSWNSEQYEWKLNAYNVQTLCEGLGTESKAWIGATVLFSYNDKTAFPYVTVSVIELPAKVSDIVTEVVE